MNQLNISDPSLTVEMLEFAREVAGSYQPIHDRILVLPLPNDERYGNIIIPDAAKERSQKGYIIAMGEGMIDANGNILTPRVTVGQKILFGKHAGSDIVIHKDLKRQEFYLIRETDIYSIIHPTAGARYFPKTHRTDKLGGEA